MLISCRSNHINKILTADENINVLLLHKQKKLPRSKRPAIEDTCQCLPLGTMSIGGAYGNRRDSCAYFVVAYSEDDCLDRQRVESICTPEKNE
jgi:hypothetical protein